MDNKSICEMIGKLAERIENSEDIELVKEIAAEVGCDPEITGKIINCKGRRIKLLKQPVPGTSKHRAQSVKVRNGKCWTPSP